MAALDFPANPTNGQEFNGYIWNATKGVWDSNSGLDFNITDLADVDTTGVVDGNALVYDGVNSQWIPGEGGGGGSYTISATAPADPGDGDVWFDSTDGLSYIYYNDGDTSQWIEIGNQTVGPQGPAGADGVDGVDGADGADGQGVSLGGLSGQVLAKASNTDFDTEWVDISTSLEGLTDTNITSPTDGQALVYDSVNSKWIPNDVSVEVYDTTNSSTGYFSIPKGTDAQRPQNPINGDMRFNTESEEPEWYSETAGQWIKFRLSPSQDFEYLVIAGGGGAGGYYSGGGGGAGGYRSSVAGQLSGGLQPEESTLSFAAGDVFTVIVGAGGVGGTNSTGGQLDGSKGSDSVLASIVSIGGGAGPGGGRTLASSVKDGGSGGGASGNVANNLGGLGTTGQGFSGGNASTNGANYGAAGGGGAGEAGQGGTLNSNGNGGAGIFSNITGTSIQRGGGGAAGSHTPLAGADGGAGGGGDGGKTANAGGSAGGINTGGGGGGPYYSSSSGGAGGAGGSGIVIIRYPATFSLTIGGGLTSVTTVVGDKKVTQFTAGLDQVTVG